MPEFTYPSAAQSLLPLAAYIDASGEEVAPRGMATREVRHATIVITDPHDCLMYGVNRVGWSPRLAAVEALQLIAGQAYPRLTATVAPATRQFMDGEVFHGAYGPRLRPQISRVINTLRCDPGSRQAVATIWDPTYDGYDDTRDTPCTVYLSFMIRKDRLIMHTHMRSNDLWWGWCYDVVQFCTLQIHVAAALGREPGEYVHYADSLHLYERDMDDVVDVAAPDGNPRKKIHLLQAKRLSDGTIVDAGWEAQRAFARNLLDGTRAYLFDPEERGLLDLPFFDDQMAKIHESA